MSDPQKCETLATPIVFLWSVLTWRLTLRWHRLVLCHTATPAVDTKIQKLHAHLAMSDALATFIFHLPHQPQHQGGACPKGAHLEKTPMVCCCVCALTVLTQGQSLMASPVCQNTQRRWWENAKFVGQSLNAKDEAAEGVRQGRSVHETQAMKDSCRWFDSHTCRFCFSGFPNFQGSTGGQKRSTIGVFPLPPPLPLPPMPDQHQWWLCLEPDAPNAFSGNPTLSHMFDS